ncbi:MAG: hypothetical protein VKK63_07660 [Synechococcus sp.]|nr:hypothetical protein [Synechococcus sp.]
MDKLQFQFGVFEHEQFNRVIVRSHGMENHENKVDLILADQSELWLLSQNLGIDPGMRKMAFDSLPKNALGIVFINRSEGIFCIFQKNVGSYTGTDGLTHVLEFYFKIPKTATLPTEFVEYYPLYNAEDYRAALPFVFESSREFYETFYKSVSEFYDKSDERFEILFNQARTLLNRVIDIRQTIQDTLADGNMRGIMYFERPTFRLQAIMEAIVRDMQPVETMKLPFQ